MSNAAVPEISDNKEVISSLLSTSPPSNFLFVNETSDALPYKAGNRHDVRSHVQKYNWKQFRETHKTTRKQAITRPALLTTQSLETYASHYSEYHKDCPYPKTRMRFSTRDLDSLSKASTLIELKESPYSTTPPSEVAEAPEPSGLEGDLTTYCKACGQPLNRLKLKQRHLSRDGSLISGGSMWKMPLNPSPVEALGAGRIDPFSSLPMDKPSHYSLELIDHGTCNLLSKRASYLDLLRPKLTHFQPSLASSPDLCPMKPHPAKSTLSQKPGLHPASKHLYYSTP